MTISNSDGKDLDVYSRVSQRGLMLVFRKKWHFLFGSGWSRNGKIHFSWNLLYIARNWHYVVHPFLV